MGFSYQLFLFALLLPLASCANPIYENCGQNFTNNNILQNNIHKAISYMVESGPNGYATSTIGDGTNTVYSLVNCRGDISTKKCSDCLATAAKQLLSICPDSAESNIWYGICSLRYNNVNFLGTPETNDFKSWFSGTEAPNPIAFDTAKWELLEWVKRASVSGTAKFAMGKKNFEANTTIYGMAQCTQDLAESACRLCLEKMTIQMSSCKGYIGCVYLSSSCALRYEISNFLDADYIPIYPSNDILYSSTSTSAGAPFTHQIMMFFISACNLWHVIGQLRN